MQLNSLLNIIKTIAIRMSINADMDLLIVMKEKKRKIIPY